METFGNQNYSIFVCKICTFNCINKNDYKRHLLTRKHQNQVNKLTEVNGNSLKTQQDICSYCGKTYSNRSGLWKHKQKCDKKVEPFDNQYIKQILEQNKELILENKEFKDKLYELASKPSMVVHNNNNKQFNLNIFLNETCKNAMNLSEFISSLVIKNEEFENMGKLGYVEGISRILIRGLRELDETKRPMHCTDKKRETLYIKENDVWNKELSQEKMKQLVLDVSFKNVRKIPAWKADHPGCDDTSSHKYLDYIQILNQVMTGIHPDKDADVEKIIRNVAASVTIDTKKNMTSKMVQNSGWL